MTWKPYSPYVSASALNLWNSCRRCFYLARRLKIERPEQKTFALQNAIDGLMKKEFDGYRERGEAHPIMRGLPGDLVPLADTRLDGWRDYREGLRAVHAPTDLTIYAVVDDIWLSQEDGSTRVVDYKTHGADKAFDLYSGWGLNYQRQLELYTYALLHSGVDLPVASTSHLVVVQPDRSAANFGGALRFDAELLTHECDLSWIDGELAEILGCLQSSAPPAADPACRFCNYVTSTAAL